MHISAWFCVATEHIGCFLEELPVGCLVVTAGGMAYVILHLSLYINGDGSVITSAQLLTYLSLGYLPDVT